MVPRRSLLSLVLSLRVNQFKSATVESSYRKLARESFDRLAVT